MIQKEQIADRRKEIAEIRHADSVFRDILAREKEREDYEERWFWELLQNAKDAVDPAQKVSARLEVSEDKISFSHTGNPFELDDILSLIIQGSSKSDKVGKTGRFGTGFMTTYLLSKRVNISGQLSGGQGCFQFNLDREASDNDEFYKLQTISNESFDNSIREDSYLGASQFQTKFVYNLDERGKETAKAGIKSLDLLIPFSQLFNQQIESIEVVSQSSITKYEKHFVEEFSIEGKKLNHYKLETITDNQVIKSFNAYVIVDEEFEICSITNSNSGVEKFEPLEKNHPRLYFTFPLIGSEEIGIPFVINSLQFDPKVERNGIYLKSGNDKTDVVRNKTIIESGLQIATEVFTKLSIIRNIEGVFELLNFKAAKDYTWIDHSWLNGLKRETLDSLSTIEFIKVADNDNPTSFNDLTVPYSSYEEKSIKIYELFKNLSNRSVVRESELYNWINICKNHIQIRELDIFEITPICGIKELIQLVAEFSNLETFTSNLINADPYQWLNDFYEITDTLFDSFPLASEILLNQEGQFRSPEGMFWDKCNDTELNAISKSLGLNFPTKLISSDIKRFTISGIVDFYENQAVAQIKAVLNDPDLDYTEELIKKANVDFLKWLISKNRKDDIKDLKILSGEPDSLNVQVLPQGSHLLLTPKSFFSGSFPFFSDLIRERDCMHAIYAEYLSETDFRFLSDHNLIHYSPLVIRNEKLNPKIIELLAVNPDDLNILKDDEGKIQREIEFEYSDFAYLTTSEGHIYDRNSTPKSCFERLRFLMLEATERDPFFNQPTFDVTVEETGKAIKFNRSLWLARAKSLQWIFIRNPNIESEKKFLSEVPSSKNLSELMKDHPDLIKSIKGENQQLFLTKIGVGVSDLIRNTLPSEDLKLSWDRAITNMITSEVDPELVQEIFNDPTIKKEYEKRLNEKKLISRNQRIGALVEKLFKEYIVELKESGTEISIERKPFGSDYLLTDESSDLVNNNAEREGFSLNNGDWLVELKASGKEFAEMTTLQADTAATTSAGYALIVVPLDGNEPDIDYLKANAKVISDIGKRVGNIISDYDDVLKRKKLLNTGKNGISVSMEDQTVRFRVESAIWNSADSSSIKDFIFTKFKTKSL